MILSSCLFSLGFCFVVPTFDLCAVFVCSRLGCCFVCGAGGGRFGAKFGFVSFLVWGCHLMVLFFIWLPNTFAFWSRNRG